MFERRLKILLIALVVATATLFGRSFWLQVVRGADYAEQERRLAVRPPELTATTRGRILDRHGAVLAVDTPCTDAAVDYRAIVDPPDPVWVEQVAVARLKARYGNDYRRTLPLAKRKPLLAETEAAVVADVGTMWATLAPLYRPSDDAAAVVAATDPAAALDEVRRQIVSRVEMRRQLLWANAYRRAQDQATAAAGRGWRRWVGLGRAKSSTTGPAGGDGADIDAFAMTTDEQRQPHVVLRALDPDAVALLGKRLDGFPGLSLRPSTHRSYPMRDVVCQTLGRVGDPTADELRRTTGADPRTRYEPTDSVGRDGVEAMCEPLLRGKRGRIDREAGGDGVVVAEERFEPGRDVRLSVDADLQNRVQGLLRHVVIHDTAGGLVTPGDGVSMHAAVVVLDVRTNQVLALASNPTFDVNELETRYAALAGDRLEEPLRNRAVMDAMNPGSTCKPMVGIGAITQGLITPYKGIECRGYLWLPSDPTNPASKPVRFPHGRCWVQSEYNLSWVQQQAARYPELYPNPITSLAHHPVPIGNPHRGHFDNPSGFLCYADALERSCNVYFETMADRLGPAGVDHWLEAFGLGRVTGIGLPQEVAGGRPSQARAMPADTPRMSNCLSGIGQGTVFATPLQVANEAATFARDGVWMRPQLLLPADAAALDAAAPPSATRPPDRVDPHLDPEGLQQARIGMVAVSGVTNIWTGELKRPAWLTVAAKTGTAEVSRVRKLVSDGHGGHVWQMLEPVVRGGPETDTPWYRSNSADKTVTHNWYMGYAPADDPQVAFAVLVEYGGSNGALGAGPVAAGVLDACVQDGYLRPPSGTTRPTTLP